MPYIKIGGREYDVADAMEPFDRSTTMPREFYLDPTLYSLEESRVMRSRWLPAARVDQVAKPGDYLAVQLLDEQLVVVRDRQGVLRVLSNVCLHRAMPIASGSGNCRTFKCPYHLWSYRLDGVLTGQPMMPEIRSAERGDVRLPEIRHEVWQGWVMINLDGNASPLFEQIQSLTVSIVGWNFSNLQPIGKASYECAANWKIIIENFCEYYHHLGLHRDSLEPFLPARSAWCLDNEGEPWNSSIIRSSQEYLSLQGEPMSDLDAAHADIMQIFTVFPLLCAGAQGSSAFWLSVTPLTAGSTRVTWHVLARPGRSDMAEFADFSLKAIDTLQREDAIACTGVQAGLRSSLAAPGRFAPLEKPIWQFQRWLLDCLIDSGFN
jgi:phenylpropionate dioxygenase-like ring-hydroxylating dioxygenase large terminal subunit